ncbi:branched-chain amino acid aminotransferase [Dictyostelium discoideum AX4]|uniref:Branched-chain-amino-acid aminotransferase n=1 Tax=Dictyostelium discoideum TaxID=44689 RepID=BCAT_DICDI|nr:branched-chain amino acid aminotransferase [Dictyostelium discoideum AX4]Q54N47.1 RecName: Full=Branched-chain-amino-acid aminotransferase [Dictyostelium discoideum]EAL64592.1 branched-chain amino acid aminotransferase [Dictyostelium discoideum AX4]|eukprot:XP_638096.1 branched-chain amino acid aminotransferase [Dictyostelium discoideum AX4]
MFGRFIRQYSTSKNIINVNELIVEKTKTPFQKYTDKTKLVFGKQFSDHMIEVQWTKEEGWGVPKISGYHNLSIPPSASVLHYALECFEGMKAYKDSNGKIRLFRPDQNMNRFLNSAKRICLPEFNKEAVIELIKKLCVLDKDWIPEGKGYSLYLRPTLIATQNSLGVGASNSALMFVIASPVGPYYPEGFKPVKLIADDQYVRAWAGGSGAFKLGSNYAPTIFPQLEAAKKGFSQVLWLLNDYVTEVGTMNMFVFWNNAQGEKELITPPLGDGTILPGVTRDSILKLTQQWGEFKITEKNFTMTELAKAIKEGRVFEAFGAGTAAIVSPIESISYKGENYSIPIDASLNCGPLTKRISDSIMAIQYGETNSDWSVIVD